jgi:hypothetical protein
MTKTLNQIIFFSSTKIRIFFQQHWKSEYFFRKKPIAKLNGPSLSGAGTDYRSVAPEFIPDFLWDSYKSLTFCVVLCPFSFGHCIVFSSSLYGLCLPH